MNTNLIKTSNSGAVQTTCDKSSIIVGWPTENDPAAINEKYSPKFFDYTLKNTDKAYLADSPTIIGVEEKFGKKAAITWLYIQITYIYVSSINKEPEAAAAILDFCKSFISGVRPYKLSELMIFFARYKSGIYDPSYYSFNPRMIGRAFFHEFIPDRNNEIAIAERRAERKKRAGQQPIDMKGYTALSMYQELKEMAAHGNGTAKDIIQGKTTMSNTEIINFLLTNKHQKK